MSETKQPHDRGTPRVDCTELKARILRLAGRPVGVAKCEVLGEQRSTISRTFDRMVNKDGNLFSAFIHKNWVRYFTTAARAEEYRVIAAEQYRKQKLKIVPKAKVRVAEGPAVNAGEVKVQYLPGYTGAPKWAMERTW